MDAVSSRLSAIGREFLDLKEAARVYGAILPLLRDADLRVCPVDLTRDEVKAHFDEGRPLLSRMDIELDGGAFHDLMRQLAYALEADGEDLEYENDSRRMRAHNIRRSLEEDRIDVPALLPHIAAGEKVRVTAVAEGLHLEPDLLWTLAQAAMKPALRAVCRQVTPLAEGTSWNRGTCFVCGAAPTLAELRDNTLVRHLRCGQCCADWRFPRLQCPYCGNEDHRTLELLFAEGQGEKRRVEVCDKCHGYLKVITSFSPIPPDMLAVEDLATLHLDFIARQRGYGRPEDR